MSTADWQQKSVVNFMPQWQRSGELPRHLADERYEECGHLDVRCSAGGNDRAQERHCLAVEVLCSRTAVVYWIPLPRAEARCCPVRRVASR